MTLRASISLHSSKTTVCLCGSVMHDALAIPETITLLLVHSYMHAMPCIHRVFVSTVTNFSVSVFHYQMLVKFSLWL